MHKIVALLKSKPYLRFFTSIQLAIPLLLIIGAVVATGTILESRYNSEYARLMVYDSSWFFGLMILLCVNIFLSTLSRYPWRKQHVGFVVVHIGLLTLLFGGFMTRFYGIDGQLRIEEGASDGKVVLGDLTLELIDVQADFAIHAPFARGSSPLTQSSLDFVNDKFNSKILVRQYLPFADIREGFSGDEGGGQGGPVAVGFMMKSQFFDVSEWLQSEERPEMKMGPATIRLIIDSASAPPTTHQAIQHHADAPPAKKTPAKKALAGKGRLIVHDESSGKTLGEFTIAQLKPGLNLGNGAILSSARTYQHAVVVSNHLAEGDQPGANPAIELQIKTDGKVVREVAYAKFPNFTLNQHKGKSYGLKFEYQIDGATPEPSETAAGDAKITGAARPPQSPTASPSERNSRTGNVIEFHVGPQGGEQVRLELYKDDTLVLNQVINPGESVVTPWMGMKVTLGSIKYGANSHIEVSPATVQPRTDLPPSAIYLTAAGTTVDQGFWLTEGQYKRLNILGREYEIYYGHRSIDLPFKIQLLQFTKTDYPGTETPMSFSSRVKVNGTGPDIDVSMNEPLYHSGYTIYQSSYDIRAGQPRASIFSVNNDPGRPVKYAGSLILGLGIIIFTLMRSRFYNQRIVKKRPNHA